MSSEVGEPRQVSLWSDSVTQPPPACLPLPARVEVAVIGGGITGLCAALALARRGVEVAVFEAQRLGWGASSRNGGMVLTGLKLGAATLLARYGRERAVRLHAASVEAVELVGELVRRERIACHFSRCGHLALASKRAHQAQFGRAAELLAREFAHPLRLLSRAGLQGEIGSTLYHGGLIDEASAGINPAQYVAGLAAAAGRAGAALHEQSAVLSLGRHGTRWRLGTARGSVEAAELLVATSGYTGALTPELQRRLLPIGSYVIATEPLAGPLAQELSPRGRMMYDSRHFLHYFRLTPGNRLLIGGRARFVPETARSVRQSAALLRQGMLAIYPQLRAARIDYAWGGTLDFAFDTMPHAGRLDGCHYALGYAGHGVALASWLGTRIGERLGSGGLDSLVFAQLPFRGAPRALRVGKDWLLPLVAAWYRLLDWVS